ncbi:hypothetical protein [Aureimonas psammosilenae]|uniref:hypothetical protein n=1 Tax=Aureimonas psammosilenae TaxID=2495496 RepID=UPI0012611935|nr:hypothetical protein [Aureimonas psammosilenae]
MQSDLGEGALSAAALKWFGRQEVADPTLSAILRALATASKANSASITQAEIASLTFLTERAVRSGLKVLEHFQMVSRQSRGGKKGGRIADEIVLTLERDFTISREEVVAARRSGSTNRINRNDGAYSTEDGSRNLLPEGEIAPKFSEVDGLYIERAGAENLNAAEVEACKEARAKVWLEKASGMWRASLLYEGIRLDLGRHEARDLAEAECRVRLLDIAHTSRSKSGTPRDPKINPALQSLTGEALCDFLFGSDEEMGRPAGREAERTGVRGHSPGQGCGGGSPYDPKEAAASAREGGRR